MLEYSHFTPPSPSQYISSPSKLGVTKDTTTPDLESVLDSKKLKFWCNFESDLQKSCRFIPSLRLLQQRCSHTAHSNACTTTCSDPKEVVAQNILSSPSLKHQSLKNSSTGRLICGGLRSFWAAIRAGPLLAGCWFLPHVRVGNDVQA